MIIISKYPYARVNVDGRYIQMTADEISRDNRFIILKENLFCPGVNCESKLLFFQRSGGFLAKHKGHEHSEDCQYKEDSIRLRRPQEVIGNIIGEIDKKSIKKRQKYAWDELEKFFNPPTDEINSQQRKRNSTRSTNASADPESVVNIATGSEGTLTEDEVPEGTRVRPPRFYFRRLDQITNQDGNNNLNIVAEIEDVTSTSDFNIEMRVSLNGREGKIYLPEAYFKGNSAHNNVQLSNSWKIVADYYKKDDPAKIYVNFQTFTDDIDINDLKISVFDPDFLNFRLRRSREMTIYSLINLINTKVI